MTHPPPTEILEPTNCPLKRQLTSSRFSVDIDALPGFTSARPRDATHGEAQFTCRIIITTGQRGFAGACLEMTTLAIAFHEVVGAFARRGLISWRRQVTVCALKIARIGIGANSLGMIRVSTLRVREGLDLQDMGQRMHGYELYLKWKRTMAEIIASTLASPRSFTAAWATAFDSTNVATAD